METSSTTTWSSWTSRRGACDSSIPIAIGCRSGPRWRGSTVGFDLLAHFVVRLDYPRQRLWLRAVPDAETTLFGAPWSSMRESGAVVGNDEQGLQVIAVLPGSAAAKRGLRVGDRIQWKGGEHDLESGTRALLGDVTGGRELRVWRADGAERSEVVIEAEKVAGEPANDAPALAPGR